MRPTEGHVLMSHQTGAMFSTLSDHNIEFIAVVKLSMAVQMAKEQAPMFQNWNIFFDIDRRTSMHAVKFAMGTRAKVGSMLSPYGVRKLIVRLLLYE